jgi:hypothetical protein
LQRGRSIYSVMLLCLHMYFNDFQSERKLRMTSKSLWWNSKHEMWSEIDFGAFLKWRGLNQSSGISNDNAAMPDLPEGYHHFVVCILDEAETVVNFISHCYGTDQAGRFLGASTVLSSEESDEWNRYYTKNAMTETETARLKKLQDRESNVHQLSQSQLEAFLRDIPWPVTTNTEFGFWRAYKSLAAKTSSLQ